MVARMVRGSRHRNRTRCRRMSFLRFPYYVGCFVLGAVLAFGWCFGDDGGFQQFVIISPPWCWFSDRRFRWSNYYFPTTTAIAADRGCPPRLDHRNRQIPIKMDSHPSPHLSAPADRHPPITCIGSPGTDFDFPGLFCSMPASF